MQNMARATGANMQSALEGGGHVKSGAIRETLVLMREISRGNWNRVPGSFSLLLQQLGVLSKLTGGQATAAQVLAQAWDKQAQKAGLAAVAAVRKASASMAAFEADELNTEATLEQAIADKEGARMAILNAKATRDKAVAAGEAAAAQGAAVGGGLATLGIGLAAVLVVALAVYETFWGFSKALEGMKMPDFNLDYVPKQLRTANQALEAQKKITDEVKKTVEAYNGAAAAAGRVEKVTGEHYDHLRKMAEFIKDPATKAARILEIDEQKRNAQLGNKYAEKQNLEIESKRKLAESNSIKVISAADEEANKKGVKERADAAREYLKKSQSGSNWEEIKKMAAASSAGAGLGDMGTGIGLLGYHQRMKAIESAQSLNTDQANAAIQAEKDFEDNEQKNKESRKKKSDAENLAAKSAAEAAKIGQEIPNIAKANAQAKKDEAELSAAELANAPHKISHGHVSNLQQVGAYTTAAVDIQKQSLHHLAKIEKNTDHLGNHAAGGVKY